MVLEGSGGDPQLWEHWVVLEGSEPWCGLLWASSSRAGLTVSSLCCSYAITVWYFDAKERTEAKEKHRLGENPTASLDPSLESLLKAGGGY